MPNHTCPAPLCSSCPGDTLVCLERQKDEREERNVTIRTILWVMTKSDFISLGSCRGWFMRKSRIVFLPMDGQVEVGRYPRVFEASFPHSPMSRLAVLLLQWKWNFQSAG